MKKLVFGFAMFIVLLGCMEGTKNRNSFQEEYAGKITFESFSVVLDSLVLDHYERGVAVFESESNVLFAAYNRHTHAIDWFDVTNESIYHRTVLDRQGPNEITGQADGIYVHTFDSIFINDGVFIYRINKNGIVKQKTPNHFETKMGTAYLVNRLTSPLHYCSSKNRLLSEAIIPGNRNVFFLEIELLTKANYLHKAGISDCFKKATIQDHFLNVSFNGDSIIYNSTCSSDIWVYDMTRKQSSVFDGKSRLSKNSTSEIKNNDTDALWKHYIENPRFFQVRYSPFDNLYYRLHWKEIDYHNDQAVDQTPYDKPVILSVFSDDFELLWESLLPADQYYVDFLISTPQGVFLNASHPNNKSYDVNIKKLNLIRFQE